MSRLTGNLALGLFEAYQAVYNPQQYTKDQLWEEVEYWVNELMREGYDLSDYTWEEMYESYDYYNTIVCYLLDEGYADTNEAALVIMANMSEEWRQSIVEEEGRYGQTTTKTPSGQTVTMNKGYPATLNKEKGVKTYGPTGTEYFTPNISGTNIPDTNRHKFKSVASKQYERVPNSNGANLTPKVDDATKYDPAYKPISMRKPGNFKY
jgi:hypothetical protein